MQLTKVKTMWKHEAMAHTVTFTYTHLASKLNQALLDKNYVFVDKNNETHGQLCSVEKTTRDRQEPCLIIEGCSDWCYKDQVFI